MKIKYLSIIALATLGLVACNKDRIEDPDYSFTNADSFFEDNKEKEQIFIITSDTGKCIVAKKGTEICSNRKGLKTDSGDTVALPYTLKVLELYTIKDYLLYRFPTETSGDPLKTEAEVRILGEKDGQKLSIKNNGAIAATLNLNAKSGNALYQETDNSDKFIDKFTSSDGSILNSNQVGLNSFKWFLPAQAYTGEKTTIKFTIKVDGVEVQATDLDFWLVQKSNKTLLHGKDLQITNVPVGEEMTAIAIAINQDDKLVFYKHSFTTLPNQGLDVNFEEKTEQEILDYMGTL
jgi:hypothetical protein